LNHTDEKSRANLMWTLQPSLLALEEPAGTWPFRAQEEPVGESRLSRRWSQQGPV
ncbi:mCG1038739, partial [Mus musculus]